MGRCGARYGAQHRARHRGCQGAVVRLAPGACVRRRRLGACVFAFDVVHSHLRCSSVGHRATVTGPHTFETRCHRNGQRPGDVLGCGRAHAVTRLRSRRTRGGLRVPGRPGGALRPGQLRGSADGAVSVDGRPGAGIRRRPPRLRPLRELAESCSSARAPCAPRTTGGAQAHPGPGHPPPVAVVTGSADLDPAPASSPTPRRADRPHRPPRPPTAASGWGGGRRRRGARPSHPGRPGRRARAPPAAPRAVRGGPALFGGLLAADPSTSCASPAPLLAAGTRAASRRGRPGRRRARMRSSARCTPRAASSCDTPDRVTGVRLGGRPTSGDDTRDTRTTDHRRKSTMTGHTHRHRHTPTTLTTGPGPATTARPRGSRRSRAGQDHDLGVGRAEDRGHRRARDLRRARHGRRGVARVRGDPGADPRRRHRCGERRGCPGGGRREAGRDRPRPGRRVRGVYRRARQGGAPQRDHRGRADDGAGSHRGQHRRQRHPPPRADDGTEVPLAPAPARVDSPSSLLAQRRHP